MKKRNKIFFFCILTFIFININGCSNIKEKNIYNLETDNIYSIENKTEIEKEEDVNLINSFIKVIDMYDIEGYETYGELFSSSDSIHRLKEFHRLLKENFVYQEFSFQPLQKLGYYEDDVKFIDKGSIMNQEITIEGKKTHVTTLKTIVVGYNFIDNFNQKISQGRNFDNDDYIYNDNNISIILGSQYKEYYKIGDVIELNYLQKNFQFEVIGFFKPNTIIEVNKQDFDLNEYICLPYFDILEIDDNENSINFQQLYYLQKNSGLILYNKKFNEDNLEYLKDKIKELSSEYNLSFSIAEGPIKITIK